MRPVFRRLLWAAIVILVAGALGLWLLERAAQHVPDFYQQALAEQFTPQYLRQTSDQLERQVLELHNHARREGHWEAEFTEQQLNAWLAADLERKFSQTLPRGVRDPRVKISPDHIQLACRYEDEHWQLVLSLTVAVFLTDTPNELAVRIREVRAGRVPLPLKQVLDAVTTQARQRALPLRWSQEQADPIALIQIPTQAEQHRGREMILESVSLRDGSVLVTGRTGRALSDQRRTP